MGQPKESLPFGGSTLLGRTVELLLEVTWPVVIVARPDQQLPPLPLESRTLTDAEPGNGPLQAIATGMRWLRGEGGLGDRDAVFVTGCDAPYLTSAVVSWLAARLGDGQLVVPRVGGVVQPLCALYRLDVLPAVEALLAEKADAPKRLVDRVRTRAVDEPELRELDPQLRFVVSVDTPEEYRAALGAGS